MTHLRYRWLLLGAGVLALRYPMYTFLAHFTERQGLQPWEANFKAWCVWDCTHYSRMSTHYTVQDVIFFPGFPWTIMGVRALIPQLNGHAATLLVSNLFSVSALLLILVFLSMLEYGDKWRASYPFNGKIWLTLALIAFFPASHFWSSGYAEPEQMTAFVVTYILVFQRKWLPACLVAGVASLIRIQACWFTAVLGGLVFFDFLQARLARPRLMGLKPLETAACLSLLVTPFLIFMGWQWIAGGDALLFIHLMSGAGRGFQFLDIFKLHLPRWDLSFILLALSHWAAFRLIRRPEVHWKFLALMTWTLAILPLAFGGFGWGYGRYMTCNLGLFIVVGEFLVTRPWFAFPVLGWSVLRLGIEIEGWTVGLWRG